MTISPHLTRPVLVAILAAATLTLGACASTQSTKAKTLKTDGAIADVRECEHVTVVPFSVPSGSKADASTGIAFSEDIAARLAVDFGPIFQSVEPGKQARGLERECVVSGAITKYQPGSKVARFILIGLGAASFEGNLNVADAASDRALMTAPFDKLWAWGGIAGASKGIEDMMKETAAAAAATVAQAKGWEPETK